MRTRNAREAKRSDEPFWGWLMSLMLLAGLIVSLNAPTRVATSFVEVGRPERTEAVAATEDASSPAATIAANDATLDLQLD